MTLKEQEEFNAIETASQRTQQAALIAEKELEEAEIAVTDALAAASGLDADATEDQKAAAQEIVAAASEALQEMEFKQEIAADDAAELTQQMADMRSEIAQESRAILKLYNHN